MFIFEKHIVFEKNVLFRYKTFVRKKCFCFARCYAISALALADAMRAAPFALRVVFAELPEFRGVGGRQDDHIGLHIALCVAGCRAVIVAGAAGGPQIGGFFIESHGVPYPPPPGVSIT